MLAAPPLAHAVKRQAAEQVGQDFYALVARHHGAFQHADLVFGAQLVKVLQRAPMDIGRVVPLIRHPLGHGHMPAQCNLQAVAPVAKVGEGNNGLLGDAG